jgi:hypothetical protein
MCIQYEKYCLNGEIKNRTKLQGCEWFKMEQIIL